MVSTILLVFFILSQSRGESNPSAFLKAIDTGSLKCYTFRIKSLPEQTGKELNSMIVREVVTS